MSIIAEMPMVRRLIHHFLSWLGQPPVQLKGEEKSRHHSSSTQQLPSTRQQHSTGSPQPDLSSPPKPTRQPPNPAAIRAVNPSKFKVLLSEYQYSPSTAVQSLSHQLANPNIQESPTKEGVQPTLESDKRLISSQQSKRDYPIQFKSSEKKKEQINHVNDKRDLKRFKTDTTNKTTTLHNQESLSNKTQISPPPSSTKSDNQITTEWLPEPVGHSPKPIPTAIDTDPQVITKKGVVKLLFKLKKNNHHGYIAPDDGSKDIIFHKKYIDNAVFSQLERGMAVEVTAHITEGKAYADCVRIL